MLVAEAGLSLNTMVIGLNGGMPVSAAVVQAIEPGVQAAIPSGDFVHVPLTAATRLRALADVLPTAGPTGVRSVTSAGDVLLLSGVAGVVVSRMLRERSRARSGRGRAAEMKEYGGRTRRLQLHRSCPPLRTRRASRGRRMPGVSRTRRFSVPDFGETVRRERMIGLYERVRPRFVVIAAPSAYGKSVLASQFARVQRFRSALWVRLPSGCASTGDMLSAAVAALAPRSTGDQDRFISLAATPGVADLADQLAAVLTQVIGEDGCLVLDNLEAACAGAIPELMNTLEGRVGLPSIVITVRASSAIPNCPIWVWQVGPRDLLLEDAEAADVAAGVLGTTPGPTTMTRLIDASGRQPGLLSLLARCGASHADDWRELAASQQDILGVLRHLAESQLDDSGRFTLACMALLAEGTTDDLRRIPGCDTEAAALRRIAAAIPMVRVEATEGSDHFIVHDLAQLAFGRRHSAECENVLDAVASVLADRDDIDTVLQMMTERRDIERLSRWLESDGLHVLKRGRLGVLDSAIGCIPPMKLVAHPRLLVLKAATDWEAGRVESAISGARVARELAEQDDDTAVLANALLILAQAALTKSDLLLARTYLDRAFELCGSSVPAETLAGLTGRRLVANAILGDSAAYEASERIVAAAKSAYIASSEESRVLLEFYCALARIVFFGDWTGSAAALGAARSSGALTRSTRAAAAYDYYGAMLETGRMSQVECAITDYETLISGLGNSGFELSLPFMREVSRLSAGEAVGASESILRVTRSAWDAGERLCVVTELFSGSTALLGNRCADEALALAEMAVSSCHQLPLGHLHWSARLAWAGAMLLVGGGDAAARTAVEVHSQLHGSPVAYHHLHADLILAEIDCQCGESATAAERLREHAPYILSESPNWLCAMYVRALPRLLGSLTAAVGANNLPVHLLRLILPEYAQEALEAARVMLSPEEHEILARRLPASSERGAAADGKSTYALRVRLFGGLEVRRPDGPISDREWRKRKARLMFAMLATRSGKDVPRDQLIEYLWPDMDATAGLNNFYVSWSCMKRALTPDSKRGDVCAYVDHRGGICKLQAGAVLTDLVEFEGLLSAAAKARLAGDYDSELAALQRVWEIYQGDLLPGEAYDDWFAVLRERCRHDYEDAMLRAAEILESRGDAKGALMLVRRAIEHDPWREDLYQSVMRLQVAAGQRSAAIETYLACRTRLVDDLGLDPSSETSRLYEQVLCMEDVPGLAQG